MTRIYLIRHAEAEGNLRRVFQGHYDGDVSENGLKQLERLSERCRSLPFDAVYASPLRRALKTAQSANRYHGLPITTLRELRELYGGLWEGLRWETFPEDFPEENRCWVNEPWNFRAPGGESMRELYDRVWSAVTGIVRQNVGKTVCIVSHGCAIRCFLCRALGKPLEQLNSIPWCDNTAVSVIDFDEDLAPRVVSLNDASHLDEETTTLGKQDWWKKFEPATLAGADMPSDTPELDNWEGDGSK